MAAKKSKDSDRDKRVAEEIAAAGGISALAHLTPEQLAVWRQQALVLSHIRDNLTYRRAAVEAGVPADYIHFWEDTDELNFTTRLRWVMRDKGQAVESRLYDMAVNGNNPNASVFRQLLPILLPETYGDEKGQKEKRDALHELEEIRRLNREFRESQDAAPYPVETYGDLPLDVHQVRAMNGAVKR